MGVPIVVDDYPTVKAVRRAMRAELGLAYSNAEALEVLNNANSLFPRALLDDLAPERRDTAKTALTNALKTVGIPIGSALADPFMCAVQNAEMIARLQPNEKLAYLLHILVAAELPGIDSLAYIEFASSGPAATAPHDNLLGSSAVNKSSPNPLSRHLLRLVRDVEDQLSAINKITSTSVASPSFPAWPCAHPSLHRHANDIHRSLTPGTQGSYTRTLFEHRSPGKSDTTITPSSHFANSTDLSVSPQMSESIGRQLARSLAQLHSTPLTASLAPLLTPLDRNRVASSIDGQYRMVKSVLATKSNPPEALAHILFKWLHANIADSKGSLVPVFGGSPLRTSMPCESYFRQPLQEEGIYFGPAAQDLAFVKEHVSRIMPWHEFISAYRDTCDSKLDENSVRFYDVWHNAWHYAETYRGLGRLIDLPRNLYDGALGLLRAPQFLLHSLESAFDLDLISAARTTRDRGRHADNSTGTTPDP